MAKALHIQLLEILENAGIAQYVDIAQFMRENFSIPIDESNPSARINDAPPTLFLDDLEERGLILPEIGDSGVWTFDPNDKYYVPNWKFDNDPSPQLNYYLTSIGLDYLDNYNYQEVQKNLNKSYKDVNEASLKNYKSQRKFSVATIAIALLAAILSGLDYIKPEPKMVELNNNIRLISKEIANLKLQLSKIESQKVIPAGSSHKP